MNLCKLTDVLVRYLNNRYQREKKMKKILFLVVFFASTITPTYADNYGGWHGRNYPGRPYSNTQIYYNRGNNWVPYAAAGLITGAIIANAYQPRYVVAPPAPVYVTPPTYAPQVYQQAYAPQAYTAPPPSQPPYMPGASVLYFCGANGLYYPQTPSCPSGWQAIPNY